jgi:hypothetical protein
MEPLTIGAILAGWFSKHAYDIINRMLDNYKSLTPEQIAALKSKFEKIENK